MEDHFVLRLPTRLAKDLRRALQSGELDQYSIRFGSFSCAWLVILWFFGVFFFASCVPCLTRVCVHADDANPRKGYFSFKRPGGAVETYPATLMDLPCNIETTRTLDDRFVYKVGDVSQVLLVHDGPYPTPPSDPDTDLPTYFLDSGLTPPTARIRSKRHAKNGRSRWWARAVHAKKTVTDLMQKEKKGKHIVELVRAEDVERYGLENASTFDVHGQLLRDRTAQQQEWLRRHAAAEPGAAADRPGDRRAQHEAVIAAHAQAMHQHAAATAAAAAAEATAAPEPWAQGTMIRIVPPSSDAGRGKAWLVDAEGGDSNYYAAPVGNPNLAEETRADATRDVVVLAPEPVAAPAAPPDEVLALRARLAKEESELREAETAVADARREVAGAVHFVQKQRLEAALRPVLAAAEAKAAQVQATRDELAAVEAAAGCAPVTSVPMDVS